MITTCLGEELFRLHLLRVLWSLWYLLFMPLLRSGKFSTIISFSRFSRPLFSFRNTYNMDILPFTYIPNFRRTLFLFILFSFVFAHLIITKVLSLRSEILALVYSNVNHIFLFYQLKIPSSNLCFFLNDFYLFSNVFIHVNIDFSHFFALSVLFYIIFSFLTISIWNPNSGISLISFRSGL